MDTQLIGWFKGRTEVCSGLSPLNASCVVIIGALVPPRSSCRPCTSIDVYQPGAFRTRPEACRVVERKGLDLQQEEMGYRVMDST